MRRLRSSFFSSSGNFELTSPMTTFFPFGMNFSGSNPPAAFGIVFKKEAVYVELREHRVGHEIVPAARQKSAFEVAAASVGAHGHVVRNILDGGIHGVDIHHGVLLRIVSELAEMILHGRVTHHCNGRVVDLKIAAARIV